MNLKQLTTGAALFASMLASPALLAGTFTGNVGIVSNYMFRGIDQSTVGGVSTSGPAVQGGIDYAFDFGMYSGLWLSNAAAANGTEADLYAGYGMNVGPFRVDGGLIYYVYSEDTEAASVPGVRSNLDYAEAFVAGTIGPASLKIFYAPEFGSDTGAASPSGDPDKNELLYVNASATLTLTDSITFVPQIGFSSGDGVKDAFGDEYSDYSITAVKKLTDDTSVSLALVGTDRELPANSGNNDNPKFVLGFKRTFNIMGAPPAKKSGR